jgi:hypothetical protein
MADIITVSVMLGDRKITLEGPQEFVQAEVRRLTDLVATGQPTTARDDTNRENARQPAEREVVETKRPKGHSEHVAVLAFCLAEVGKPEFSEDEMRRAYIRAGVKPPKAVGQAIRDAKDDYDYIELGSKRGTYTLSQHGENFVRFDLPRKE